LSTRFHFSTISRASQWFCCATNLSCSSTRCGSPAT
jgi:hypothetical protein